MYKTVGYGPTFAIKMRKMTYFDGPHAVEVIFLWDPSKNFDIK
jgi:hypothetical protein